MRSNTFGTVVSALLLAAVILGYIAYMQYQREAEVLQNPGVVCAEGWEYMVFNSFEACVHQKAPTVRFVVEEPNEGVAREVTYTEEEGWLSSASPR